MAVTAFFYDRTKATNRRYENVEQMQFGMEIIKGRPTRIIYVFLPDNKVETLKQCEFELTLVHQ